MRITYCTRQIYSKSIAQRAITAVEIVLAVFQTHQLRRLRLFPKYTTNIVSFLFLRSRVRCVRTVSWFVHDEASEVIPNRT